ncbi:hypothetical protein C8T65DRAFT_736360 [Cerioporus squamosus]|nr:hypothetical protein C8T65DRAFT_736360 [Cerioporus squamosus]
MNAITLGIPINTSWQVLKRCFRCPRIKSLTFYPSAALTGPHNQPYPLDDDVAITLSTFSCNVPSWREETYFDDTMTLRERFAREAACLKVIVPRMNHTAYVTKSYSRLSELELHRYQANREEEVDHVHITTLLSAAHSLRVARLNLDFHEDHGPYCDDFPARKELVKILEEKCPFLERVNVLYHRIPTTTWAEFHSSRSAEPHFVLIEHHPERWDSQSLPYEWYRTSQVEAYQTELEGSTPPPEDATGHPQVAVCTSLAPLS